MVNANKLKGKIVESGFTLTTFAEAFNLSRQSLTKKIQGKVEFNASEIKKTREILNLSLEDTDTIFFA